MPKKIKNPLKYIHKLKIEIARLKERIYDEQKRRRQYAGYCVVNWADGEPDKEECSSQKLGDFRVGDCVAITGRILEVHEKEGSSMIRFRRIQTKKVDAI